MRPVTGFAAVLFVLSLTCAGFAGSDFPDLKGTWIVKCSGHKAETPGAPLSNLYKAPPGFHEIEFPLIIDQQDGFRFSGRRQISKEGGKAISGVIGFDNQSVYMADENGIAMGKLVSPDQMECIYLESVRHRSIASREIITRKR